MLTNAQVCDYLFVHHHFVYILAGYFYKTLNGNKSAINILIVQIVILIFCGNLDLFNC